MTWVLDKGDVGTGQEGHGYWTRVMWVMDKSDMGTGQG